jgi:hypothetical protein
MAQDMRRLDLMPGLDADTLALLCRLVVATVINAINDILDLPSGHAQAEREQLQELTRQLRMIFLGAQRWRAGRERVDSGESAGARGAARDTPDGGRVA